MARLITKKLEIPHKILRIGLENIGGSSLTDRNIPLEEYDNLKEIREKIPSTYVPFRNGIFLALAAAWAETNGFKKIICGFNWIDSPHYPDTSSEFVQAMEKAINSGTKYGKGRERLRIVAPFVSWKKSKIIEEGLNLGADYSHSISCYQGEEIPCQRCAACLMRKRAWQEAGIPDPLLVRLKKEGKL